MTDTDHLDRLRSQFYTGEIPIARGDCLDDDTVAALAEGALGDAARARALAHMATCAFCRHSVASLASALADRPITHEIEVIEGRSRSRRVLWFALPVAAAALVVVMIGRFSQVQPEPPVLRDSVVTDTTVRAPVLITPAAIIARVDQFVWSRVPKAERYRVRLYDEEGDVLWTTETADTVVAMPNSIRLAPGANYFWTVEAQREWGKWVASDLIEFRLGGPSR